MKNIKKFIMVVVFAMAVFTLVSCTKDSKDTVKKNEDTTKKVIKIAYLPITHAVPIYIEDALQETELKSDVKIELVKFGSWPELMDALNSGRVDGASLLVQLAMGAKEKGIPLKTVALGHTDGNVIVSSKKINFPKDLKGKTFAIPHKMSSHNILLKQMLKKNNMKIEDLKIIELAPPEMPAALSEGRIDAYAVAEPFGAKAVASDKGKVLLRSDDVWENSVCCALALREDFINKNKDTAQTFMNNYVKAGKIASQDKEKTAEIVSKYLKVDEKVLDLSLGWIKYDNLKITEEHYNLLKDYMVEYGISKNPPAFKDMVDNSLIDNVK